VYATADGRHVAVGPLESKFWAEFAALLELDGDLTPYDPGAWPALREQIAARIATRTMADWCAVFDGSDACVAPVLSLSEAAAGSHPHLAERGTFVEAYGVRQPAPAPRFSVTASSLPSAPPRPGEHTRVALTDWGVPDVEGLIAAGIVVADAPY
jgi:alpha-methylacyl-CoA racemase